MTITDWNIENITGYKPITTFYTDFSIADAFGKAAILDTYQRAFDSWKEDIKYITELVMVLNWKCWEHYDKGNSAYSILYEDLYHKLDGYVLDNFTGDDVTYYLRTTD